MAPNGQKRLSRSPLAQPGPHGYPMRFAVRIAGLKGLKVYGDDPDQPIRFIEVHTRRHVLHASGHKKDNSPALVSIKSNWPAWSFFPVGDQAAYTITVHSDGPKADPTDDGSSETDNNPPDASQPPPANTTTNDDEDAVTVPMEHTCCRPVTFEFSLPPGLTDTGRTETFEWRRAPSCHETRGIRKKTLPLLETGDERPPETTLQTWFAQPGSVLVRVTGARWPPNGNNVDNGRIYATAAAAASGDGEGSQTPPLGFTRQGEEIVASWTLARDCRPRYYFQFWGAGATGELGTVFTHVAVLTGNAVYLDEIATRAKAQAGHGGGVAGDMMGGGGGGGQHGVAPGLLSLPAHVGGGGGGGHRVHLAQHGSHPPGHLAALCGMP